MNDTRLVLRNTALLLLAQAAVTPLSIAINVLMARALGPKEFGALYLAATFVGFGMLFVEWGQGAVLTARVAQDRSHAGQLLGSSLLFRCVSAVLVLGALMLIARYLGHDAGFAVVLALSAAAALFASLAIAVQDVFRGFERMDFAAGSYVAYQYFVALVVVPVLWFGGGLRHVLAAQAACSLLGLGAVLLALRPLGVPRLAARRSSLRELLQQGTPFLGFGIALALQPNVDALFLANWASADAIGWHAAAKRLIGVLVAPAGAIIGGLYPTLCRLYPTDREQYALTARSALVTTALCVIPVALCCAFYPDVGVRIFSRAAFGPAEDNLRVLSLYLLLAYFSMPLGTCLVSAGLTRPWTLAQLGCVAISAGLCPPLIRYFQEGRGNGGLGVCVAMVVSEVAMVAVALWMVPKGVLDRSLAKRLARACVAGAAMALVARLLSWLSPFVGAPLALLTYALCLRATGGITAEETERIFAYLRRKLARR
jgi:O-antigen/teichoic acid export membrane protein